MDDTHIHGRKTQHFDTNDGDVPNRFVKEEEKDDDDGGGCFFIDDGGVYFARRRRHRCDIDCTMPPPA